MKTWTSFAIFLFAFNALAQGADLSMVSISHPNIILNEEPSHYRLLIPSMVLHGLQPNASTVAAMPRRLDRSANFVATPGFGIEYHSDENLVLVLAMVKDCFDNLAGTLQIGQTFYYSRKSFWSWSFGFYARQSPTICDKDGCSDIGGYPLTFKTNFNGFDVDVLPVPFLHYTRELYKDQHFQLNLKLMANFIFNEIGFEVPL
jgi:hypothetical protein